MIERCAAGEKLEGLAGGGVVKPVVVVVAVAFVDIAADEHAVLVIHILVDSASMCGNTESVPKLVSSS